MSVSHFKPETRQVLGRCGQGFIEEYAGPFGTLPVLHVMGSAEEMGRQYGALAGASVKRTYQCILEHRGQSSAEALDQTWNQMEPHIGERYKREIIAIVRGAQSEGIRLEMRDIECIIAASELERDEGNRQHGAIWGERADDGRMFSFRNHNRFSKTGLHEERLITVYTPEDGVPFVTCGYAGFIGAFTGMNELGITLPQFDVGASDSDTDYTPWMLTAREALEFSETPEEAQLTIQEMDTRMQCSIAFGDPERYCLPNFRPRVVSTSENPDECQLGTGTSEEIGSDEMLAIAQTAGQRHATETWNTLSAVYANTDLDFWVAYETCDNGGAWTKASDGVYWQFNLAELVAAAPHETDFRH